MNRIEQLLEFLQESPGDSFLTHALALEYIKGGDDVLGRFYFERNRERSPEYVPTYYHLGKLLERNNETDYALTIYSKGMEQARAAGDNHAYMELKSVYEELIY